MAKKGGVQQLQADINTDEEFERFLERPGLLVLDVYTEWCGPCIGMVGSLKKIKLELGGDNLQLAICKSDTIEALERFRNKSEPTWLFVSQQKAVNIMFGTNVPKLMKLIAKELELEQKQTRTTFYEITEMQPMELEIYNLLKAAEDQARLAEQQAAEAKRRAYLMSVTDSIMKNMPDMGVTIFGPHIQRDNYKKLMEPADAQKISCKDRRILQVTKEDLEVLHFSCKNRLPDDVWEYMLGKDILTCLWKANDSDTRPIEEILAVYVNNCIKPIPVLDDFGNVIRGKTLAPVLPPLEVKIAPPVEAVDEEELEKEMLVEDETADDLLGGLLESAELAGEEGEEEELPEDEEEAPETLPSTEEAKTIPKAKEEIKIIKIPAVWAPGNHRTNAAAIYLFYRWHTGTFLPPDPVEEPPHLAIAFEAYKRKDIADVCERFKDDILAYGYFTTANPDTAQLITNSTKRYNSRPPQVTDKLVMKLSKKTSHALLSLATHGPCYISANTVEGEKECKKFFPKDYVTEGDEIEKKKKKTKKRTPQGETDSAYEEVGATEDAVEAAEQVEEAGAEHEGIAVTEPEVTEGEPAAGDAKAEDAVTEAFADASPEAGAPPTESTTPPPSSPGATGEAPPETAPPESASPEPAPPESTPAEQSPPETPAEDSKPVAGDEDQTEGEGEANAEPQPEEG